MRIRNSLTNLEATPTKIKYENIGWPLFCCLAVIPSFFVIRGRKYFRPFFLYSTMISTWLDCCRSSSLPRPWWPFCRPLEKAGGPRSEGPRGCLWGCPLSREENSLLLLTDLLLPIAPALTGPLVSCCSSGWKELDESGPRRRRGLPPFGPPLLPRDMLLKPLIRPSSRN